MCCHSNNLSLKAPDDDNNNKNSVTMALGFSEENWSEQTLGSSVQLKVDSFSQTFKRSCSSSSSVEEDKPSGSLLNREESNQTQQLSDGVVTDCDNAGFKNDVKQLLTGEEELEVTEPLQVLLLEPQLSQPVDNGGNDCGSDVEGPDGLYKVRKCRPGGFQPDYHWDQVDLWQQPRPRPYHEYQQWNNSPHYDWHRRHQGCHPHCQCDPRQHLPNPYWFNKYHRHNRYDQGHDRPFYGPSSRPFIHREPEEVIIESTGVGAGLYNMGNTCFINAILQCFLHTVPLVEGVRSHSHPLPCDGSAGEGVCVICALRDLSELSFSNSGWKISPSQIVDNLNYFSSFFQRHQQEDAHEFLQCFLDKLERCCLDLKTQEDSSPQDANLVQQVFGGRLLSKLQCCNCGHCSETYEPLIDLSLEIDDVDTLPCALESFTKLEKIDDPDMRFTCDNCKEKVAVEKQLLVDQAPPIAAFHLKRFKTDGFSVMKITNHVEFPLELDLLPYTSENLDIDVELRYELYAIVVHIGSRSTSGHYFCYVQSSPGIWHKLDDEKVVEVEEELVLSQRAYILFYAKHGTPWFSSSFTVKKPELNTGQSNSSPKSVLDNLENEASSNCFALNTESCAANESTRLFTQLSLGARDVVLVSEATNAAEEISLDYDESRLDAPTTESVVLVGKSAHSSETDARMPDGESADGNETDAAVLVVKGAHRNETGAISVGESAHSDETFFNEKSSTLLSSRSNSNLGTSIAEEDGHFHSPTRPLSASANPGLRGRKDESDNILQSNLKSPVAFKKQQKRDAKNSGKIEAVRYFNKKNMPMNRRKMLMRAMMGSPSKIRKLKVSPSPSKKRKLKASPCKKGSPNARRKLNHTCLLSS